MSHSKIKSIQTSGVDIDLWNTSNQTQIAKAMSICSLKCNPNIQRFYMRKDAWKEFEIPPLPDQFCYFHLLSHAQCAIMICAVSTYENHFEYPKDERAIMKVEFTDHDALKRFLHLVSWSYHTEKQKERKQRLTETNVNCFIKHLTAWESETKRDRHQFWYPMFVTLLKGIFVDIQLINVDHWIEVCTPELDKLLYYMYEVCHDYEPRDLKRMMQWPDEKQTICYEEVEAPYVDVTSSVPIIDVITPLADIHWNLCDSFKPVLSDVLRDLSDIFHVCAFDYVFEFFNTKKLS